MLPDPKQKALTLEEVAGILSLCTETVRREILRKRLRAFKAGREWRVWKCDLDDYAAKGGLV